MKVGDLTSKVFTSRPRPPTVNLRNDGGIRSCYSRTSTGGRMGVVGVWVAFHPCCPRRRLEGFEK